MWLRTFNVLILIAFIHGSKSIPDAEELIKPLQVDTQNAALPRTCSPTVNRFSGIQQIYPQPGFGQPFEVFCDQEYEGGGWIVIQNRFEGSVHFSRDWSAYEHGFGDINNGEMWLGLAKIHELTYSGRYELHVIVENWEGKQGVAKYSEFLVAGPSEKYELKSIGTFTGNAGDGLNWHKNMKFSTLDEDNDRSFENCAKIHHGGWWFNNCHSSNLNGLYKSGTYIDAIFWERFGFDIKRTRMLIRVIP